MDDYDLVVIGAGASGLGAARAAVTRGARTLLVSDSEPGGDCTFTGCVPSKTLIESARSGVSYALATQRIRDVIATIAATEDADALRSEGIDVILDRARFRSPNRIDVGVRTISARRVVIATGSTPAVPDVPGLRDVDFLTTETVFDLPTLPQSLAIVGGGTTGCELAQAFHRLGSHVTLIEQADRLLSDQDPDASAIITEVLRRDGIDVHLSTRLKSVVQGPRLELDDGTSLAATHILIAAGRRPPAVDLGLGAAGVDVDHRGYIRTDQHLATTARGIYAAGDVTGRLQLTHAAHAMGRLAAANALSRRPNIYREDVVPRVTFTDPEVAQVGILATNAPRRARIAELPMSGLDRALTAGAVDGFVKLVAGRRRLLGNAGGGRILGATIVAERAGELIHEPALAMATRMFTGRLAATSHAYPTWSMAVQLAAAQFFMTVDGRTARTVTAITEQA
ncbi:dihydrolipoyl dehydrogenase family protein [Kribbella catacumbae]|uniref:dihydrolipoyl dehydrogenase family protein n=1 Tax=Kribbella catacumbae TaxID=460086 RepID=UPI000373190D|nr:FAD-dependent oxidoreductase [Kribbella catacumbae]